MVFKIKNGVKSNLNAIFKDAFCSYKLSIGFFDDKNRVHANGETSAEIASHHVLGSVINKLPKRDFIVQVIKGSVELITKAFQNAINNTTFSRFFLFPVFRYTGHTITDRIQAFLNNNGEGKLTPLSEKTIQRKKHDRMLEDTKMMKDDLQSKVLKNN